MTQLTRQTLTPDQQEILKTCQTDSLGYSLGCLLALTRTQKISPTSYQTARGFILADISWAVQDPENQKISQTQLDLAVQAVTARLFLEFPVLAQDQGLLVQFLEFWAESQAGFWETFFRLAVWNWPSPWSVLTPGSAQIPGQNSWIIWPST